MAATAFVIAFPNGDYEYDVRQGAAPTIGDEIRRRGVLWSVTSITQGSVAIMHVERVDAPAASSVHAVPPGESKSLRGREEQGVYIPTVPILILRFPDGDVEHRSTPRELTVGTRIRARGTLWRVTARTGNAVHLEPYEEEAVDGAPTPTVPTIVPTALGDEPLIIEILSAA